MHTLRVSMNVTETTKKLSQKSIDGYLNEINKTKGLKASFKQLPFGKEFIYINVDFVALVGSYEINQQNLDLAKELIYNSIPKLLLCKTELKIQRLDFRYDAKINNQYDRHFLIKTIQMKSYEKIRTKRKQQVEETTIYFNAKSSVILIYDKSAERISKGIAPANEEEDVLRFEFSVRSKHLDYMKRAYELDKTLDNYMTIKMYNKYISEIIKIIGSEDFHKFSVAKNIITSANLSSKEKNLCINYLNDVTRSSLSQIKQKKVNGKLKYSSVKLKQIRSLLSALNINQLIISKHLNCSNTIDNPLKNALLDNNTFADETNK